MGGWLGTFFATAAFAVSVLVAVWAIWLIVDAHEEIGLEYGPPALALAVVGVTTTAVVWRRGSG